jgi:hypothetical protein
MAGWDAFQYLRWLRHLGKIMYVIVLAVVGMSWWAVMSSTRGDIAHGGITALVVLLAVLAFNFMVRGLPPCRLCLCAGAPLTLLHSGLLE